MNDLFTIDFTERNATGELIWQDTNMKYKVGDRVKITTTGMHPFDVGDRVKIVDIDEHDNGLPYLVKGAETGKWWLGENDLERVTDKSELNAYFQSIHAAAVKQPEVEGAKAQALLSAFFSELADLVNDLGRDAGKL